MRTLLSLRLLSPRRISFRPLQLKHSGFASQTCLAQTPLAEAHLSPTQTWLFLASLIFSHSDTQTSKPLISLTLASSYLSQTLTISHSFSATPARLNGNFPKLPQASLIETTSNVSYKLQTYLLFLSWLSFYSNFRCPDLAFSRFANCLPSLSLSLQYFSLQLPSLNLVSPTMTLPHLSNFSSQLIEPTFYWQHLATFSHSNFSLSLLLYPKWKLLWALP